MAPKNKFTKEEMTAAALRVVRAKGIAGLTAKTMADELGTSTQPIFTGFGSMDSVRQEVYVAAMRVYDRYTDAGLKEKIPFLGVGMQYIRFARGGAGTLPLPVFNPGAGTGIRHHAIHAASANARPSDADAHLPHDRRRGRSLFPQPVVVVHGLSTLIVTGDCPYSDREIGQILTGFSVSICKSIKEIPGFADGSFDRDAVFRGLFN